MSADMAFHVWFLFVALIAMIGSVLARVVSEIPLLFRIMVIVALIGCFVFYRLLRKG